MPESIYSALIIMQRKIIILFILFILFILSELLPCTKFGGPALADSPLSQIVNRHSQSVVMITAYDKSGLLVSSGSGFFITGTGDIATSHHVLEGSVKAIVQTLDGQKGEIIEITNDDGRLDLSVARTTIRNSTPLILGDSDRIRTGDDIVGMGILPGSERAISMGTVSRLRKAEDIKLMQITAPISPGTSGGPILALSGVLSGNVIGIATAFLDMGRDMNFAIPVNYLKTLKSTRLKLDALPRMTTRFAAVVRNEELLELLVTRKAKWPGTVYFKNGKSLNCDRAWKDGRTVFLVVHGKKMAIGYDESLIDMERSFIGVGR